MTKDRVEHNEGSNQEPSFLLDELVAKRRNELITQRRIREKSAPQPAWQFFPSIASVGLTAAVGAGLYLLSRRNNPSNLILAGMAITMLFSEIVRAINSKLNECENRLEEAKRSHYLPYQTHKRHLSDPTSRKSNEPRDFPRLK